MAKREPKTIIRGVSPPTIYLALAVNKGKKYPYASKRQGSK